MAIGLLVKRGLEHLMNPQRDSLRFMASLPLHRPGDFPGGCLALPVQLAASDLLPLPPPPCRDTPAARPLSLASPRAMPGVKFLEPSPLGANERSRLGLPLLEGPPLPHPCTPALLFPAGHVLDAGNRQLFLPRQHPPNSRHPGGESPGPGQAVFQPTCHPWPVTFLYLRFLLAVSVDQRPMTWKVQNLLGPQGGSHIPLPEKFG